MVTIADVARHAGVAPSTVSYVLTGKRAISEETADRVWGSIRSLGYRPRGGMPSSAAVGAIGVLLPLRGGVNVAVAMRFVRAVVDTSRRRDRDVLVITADEGADGVLRAAESVAGLVVMDVEMDDPRVPALRSSPTPSVLIGVPTDPSGLSCVDLGFSAAYAMCVDHLADRGHLDIALLGAPRAVYERRTGYAERGVAGFSAAALRRGVNFVVRACESDGLAAKRLLAEHSEITGIVVHNEAALPAVVAGARSSVDVVAVCPDEVARRTEPKVSSVHVPAEDLGRRAVELLAARIDGAAPFGVELSRPVLTGRS
ncbi:LacI family DNA-binding transcriptional regulator [Kutzneria sp. CA-103260]|uniref:LacI family DNA-binding transcriptional regulator n=1 Tax=Kutzneria sp. CA-103260 TaxID=2802641 RepID=UPI001BAB198B|nr:LacI family DNA-binding transcriptional regulator [Kutzneria sp. CA-103260]QUQ64281.1 transcriptional regulator [Kutzneria sp. CA-103260]